MSKMIPYIPKDYDKLSKEGIIFEKLEKLPDDFVVFHSLEITSIKNRGIKESEVDFVIFHPKKGLLALEAKAGSVYHEDGVWYYGSGLKMHHQGPFNQAKRNKYLIKDLIIRSGNLYGLLDKISLKHAVCFHSIERAKIVTTKLPPDSPKELIICKDDLDNLETAINRIFSFQSSNSIGIHLDDKESKYLLYDVLCPKYNLIPSKTLELDLTKQKFTQLLNEQSVILNFLEDQPNATISGAAGTGKTMIAIEKARRHADKNENVLFLCFNSFLKTHLEENYSHDYIDFFTINSFAIKYTKSIYNSFELLKRYLEDVYLNELEFKYKHIIIDEGQDFGQNNIEEQDIISVFKMIIEQRNGTFYIFYDKNQLVQGKAIPAYIIDSDTKLNLYKNCRNTVNIANASISLLNQEARLHDGAILGDTPNMHFTQTNEEALIRLNIVIQRLLDQSIKDIVILTTKASESSILKDFDEGYYLMNNQRIKWTTARKFKGLEADAIILFEIDKRTLLEEKLLFYVGASRARLFLHTIVIMTISDLEEVLKNYKLLLKIANPQKALATLINSIIVK